MAYQPKVVVVFDRTVVVAAQFVEEAAALRRQTAEAILEHSAQNAAEVTGSLKAGHYLVDELASTYQSAVAAARAKNPGVEILPEAPAEPNTTIIAVAVAHGAPAEFYTGEKNPDAHPYLGPAAEAERPAFEAALSALGGRIR